MPKSALINAEKADAYAREFKCLTRREQKLICTLCSTEISYGMRSQVIHHIKFETQEQTATIRATNFTIQLSSDKLLCHTLV